MCLGEVLVRCTKLRKLDMSGATLGGKHFLNTFDWVDELPIPLRSPLTHINLKVRHCTLMYIYV